MIKIRYIESHSNDAFYNMALEQYVFDELPKDEEYFMLWQNANAIVVGRYQNTNEELNAEYVKDNEIQVVRRLSGGGAMYQDLGNLNFTFVVNQNKVSGIDFTMFTDTIVEALSQIGLNAENNSRNDITIDNKKFSGNSQYIKKGRVMHHGTILFNSNLNVIGNALQVSKDKYESKGIKSVRSRVTNIYPYLENEVTVLEFKNILLQNLFKNQILPYELTNKDNEKIEKLAKIKYETWEWNYGKSPFFNLVKERKFNMGKIKAYLEVDKGIIKNINLYGDFFGNGDIKEVEDSLKGIRYHEESIKEALKNIPVKERIHGMDANELAEILFL